MRRALILTGLWGCLEASSALGVARVIDGDTLVTRDGVTLRLFGIDTPERGECGYRAATSALRDRLEGAPINWRPPQPERGDRGGDVDDYGRRVAEIFVEGRSINLELLEAGLARTTWFSAEVDAYRAAERRARRDQRGSWARCEGF